jgi:hypothetical protein
MEGRVCINCGAAFDRRLSYCSYCWARVEEKKEQCGSCKHGSVSGHTCEVCFDAAGGAPDFRSRSPVDSPLGEVPRSVLERLAIANATGARFATAKAKAEKGGTGDGWTDYDTRCRIAWALNRPPFGLSAERVESVLAVFRHGDEKRVKDPDLPRGNSTSRFFEHIGHAKRHWMRRGSRRDDRFGVEDESGINHRAHVIARLMLAIASVCDDWKCDE